MQSVRTEQLTRIYRQDSIEVVALKDVNLSINAGEFLALVGPFRLG